MITLIFVQWKYGKILPSMSEPVGSFKGYITLVTPSCLTRLCMPFTIDERFSILLNAKTLDSFQNSFFSYIVSYLFSPGVSSH
jgi:hypothetical protein